nr:hypothetical protein [Streptomyces sp. YIM 132580]
MTQLRGRLLELDVEDVRPVRSEADAPEGAKSGELIAAGAMVLSLAPTLFRPVLRVVETWMQNRPVRTVKIEINGHQMELGHASPAQQQRVVEAFLAEVRGSSPESPTRDGEEEASAEELPEAGSSCPPGP